MIRLRWRDGGAELQPGRLVVAHRGFALGWIPAAPLAFAVDPRGAPVAWSSYPVPPVLLIDGAARAFPVITTRPRWDAKSFGSERRGKLHRHHAAVDLHGEMGEAVVSPVDGQIIGEQPYYRTNSGKQTDALLIWDGTTTYLLGEIIPGSPAAAGVQVGDQVLAGQHVAAVGPTGHLHFGTYAGRHRAMTDGERWYWGQAPPPHLRDPGAFLQASIALDAPRSPTPPPAPAPDLPPAPPPAPAPDLPGWSPVPPPEDLPGWSPAPPPEDLPGWSPAPPPEDLPPDPGTGIPWTPADPLYTPAEPEIPWTPAPQDWHHERAPASGRWGIAVLALLFALAVSTDRRRRR